ncbi:aminotransferase class I/II-fold pyridoxal phosphate-dependent enzyme, partial [candidate division KSB1 bacterium]
QILIQNYDKCTETGMWFKRMPLEEWFDKYQYEVKFDIGESAVKFHNFKDLDLDLDKVELRYGYHLGRPDLREKISEQYNGLNSNNILVTSAGSESIFSINSLLVKPGDHVIIEHPTYPSLYEVPRSLGCEVSLLSLKFENDFQPDIDELKSLIKPNTKLINFTHPNNPTGSMISKDSLEQIIEIAESNDIYFLFDETYRDLSYGEKLPAAAELSPKAISISSMSKCYGLPGIRIGWLASKSKEIVDGVLAVREQITITNSAMGEEIALRTLEQKDHHIKNAIDHVNKNFNIVCNWIKERNELEWIKPEAGVVSLPHLKTGILDDPEILYRTLVEKYKTFVIPGRCFELDNSYFRLGYGGTTEELKAGLENFRNALDEVKNS